MSRKLINLRLKQKTGGLIAGVFCLFLLFWAVFAQAAESALSSDQAFSFYTTVEDSQTILTIWNVKPGYYLYRDRIRFSITNPQTATLSKPLWPKAQFSKNYPGLGKIPAYSGQFTIPIPILHASSDTITLVVSYQGCSKAGYCYPPMIKQVTLDLTKNYGAAIYPAPATADQIAAANTNSNLSEQASQKTNAPHLFNTQNIFIMLLSFFGFGLLLSLTPCVLPMIPILASIIAGQKEKSRVYLFCLSLTYVLAMAITYAIAGLIVGLVGSNLQATFQKPWILILFSIIFVLLALSLFGLYDIRLPERWQNRLTQISNRQKRGSYIGTAIMGCLSTLIVSPCVTPALVGVLGYISQTGHAALGGLALFVTGLGMGVPLLLIGVFSAAILPKAGSWMDCIKYILGLLLLALAIWMLSRILPDPVTLALWGILAIGTAIILGAFETATKTIQKLWKTLGILFFIYGIALILGAGLHHSDPFDPLDFKNMRGTFSQEESVVPTQNEFIPIKTINDVQQELKTATTQGKITILDFYASWCVSCQEMEKFSWRDRKVQSILGQFHLLRADVTQNDDADKALEKQYGIIGPPTILFFNIYGQEIPNSRIVGKVSASTLLEHLRQLESP